MSIEARVAVYRDGTKTETLSACERLLASYALSDKCAVALAESGSVTRGHRASMHAHLVAILNREGEREARQFLRLLAAQVGLECRPNPDDHFDPEPLDLTDWNKVQIG
jgi:hypothetical protein